MKSIDNLIYTDSQNNSLDFLKTVCTVLIVGSHLLPLSSNRLFNLIYGQWIFRFSVPVFFISSGFFFDGMKQEKRRQYLKRILFLYIVSTILYSPFIIRTYLSGNVSRIGLIKFLIFGYDHLWYLIALFYSLLLWFLISKIRFIRRRINTNIFRFIILTLLLMGAFFDEYYHLFGNNLIITEIGSKIERVGSTRSALFMGIPMVLIGREIYEKRLEAAKIKKKLLWTGVTIFSGLSFFELVILTGGLKDNYSLTCDITLFNWVPGALLFIIAMITKTEMDYKQLKSLRKTDDEVYVIHPFIRNVIGVLNDSIRYFIRFVVVLGISYMLGYLVVSLINKVRKRTDTRE